MKKKFLSMFLAAIMVISLLPIKAFAADTVTYIDAAGVTQSCDNYTQVAGSNTDTAWDEGTYVVSGDVIINGGLVINGSARLILCDDAKLIVVGGINLPEDTVFEICGQEGRSGQFKVLDYIHGDDIIINGGIINVTHSHTDSINCNNLVINDGIVEAVGGTEYYSGMGIEADESITINGGYVKAVGGGGPYEGYAASGLLCTDITINDGIVEAVGATTYFGGNFGINTRELVSGVLKVNGGIVTIIGGEDCAAIFSNAEEGTGFDITIGDDAGDVTVSTDGTEYVAWNGTDALTDFRAVKFTYETQLPPIFDPCNGKALIRGASVNAAPAANPMWGNYVFDGWYTQKMGGTKVTDNFDNTKTYYAHWWTNSDKNSFVLTDGVAVTADSVYFGTRATAVPAAELALYGLAYDCENGIFTMNNAAIEASDGVCFYADEYNRYCAALYAEPAELTIKLIGENTIHLWKDFGNRYGFSNRNGVVIKGDKLNVACDGSIYGNAFGIYANDNSYIDAEVIATAGNAGGYSLGMAIKYGNLILEENTKLTCTGGNAMVSYGLSVDQGTLTCNKATTLTATGSESGEYSCGVFCKGNETGGITILDDAKLTAASGRTAYSYAVECGGKIHNCGKFTATASDATATALGVFCRSDIENVFDSQGKISEFTAKAGESDYACGVYSITDITNECLLTAICNSEGIGCEGEFTVLNGVVTSHGMVYANPISTADDMLVTGYDETEGEFVSGTTAVLYKSGTNPIVISTSGSFSVIYNENEAENGSVPTDANEYAFAAEVTVPGNTGSLTKAGYRFDGWNTKADGTGETYRANETFTIGANTILYARWIKDIRLTVTATPETVLTGGDVLISGTVMDVVTPVAGGTVSITVNGNNYDRQTDENGCFSEVIENLPVGTYMCTATYTLDGNSYSASVIIDVIAHHVHNLVWVNGRIPTETTCGWKAYYECKDIEDACGRCFEDANGYIPIGNLATWATKGGAGYLPSIRETQASEPVPTQAPEVVPVREPESGSETDVTDVTDTTDSTDSTGETPTVEYDNIKEILLAEAATTKKGYIKLSWNKIDGAVKYVVYGAKCGKSYKKLTETEKASFTIKKISGAKPVPGKAYKLYVVAYDELGNKVKSKSIHYIVGDTSAKYANVKTITASQKTLELTVGEKAAVGAEYTMYEDKEQISKKHGRTLRFTSNCPEVAKVSKDGKVTAKKAGKATIYIQSVSGKWCKVEVTVK